MYPSHLVLAPRSSSVPHPHLTLVREAAPQYASVAFDRSAVPAQTDSVPHDPAGERADALLELGDRIAELFRSIHVAEAETMRLIVAFDDARGWADVGFSCCAEWLAWRIGVRLNAARERVRTARALAGLPRASAAMAAGELSYAKARALTRVATPQSEDALLDLARAGSADNLERVVRAWKAMDDAQECTAEILRHRNRRFGVYVDDDGSYVLRGRLDPEAGAMLMRAVEAASDALFRAEVDPEDTTPAQRRADAVALLAEQALAVGFDESPRGTRADRYQVLLHVDSDTLRDDRPSGRSQLDQVRVCKETARRLTCDAGVSRIAAGGRSDAAGGRSDVADASGVTAVTSAGRRSRTVPPALRRALLARDRGCRFPGCGSRFVEAHHIVHWADGGPTELTNLVLLCSRHHRHVHENGMRVCLDRTSAVVFFTADGRALTGAPAPTSDDPALLPPAPPSVSPYPGAARFDRDHAIPWTLEARAVEAMDTG